jgi:hypothetical protein
MPLPEPNLELFEQRVMAREGMGAVDVAISILESIDKQYGSIQQVKWTPSRGRLTADERIEQFATRFCAAFSQLMCDQSFNIAPVALELLLIFHRWTLLLYGDSGFKTSEYLLPLLARDPSNDTWTLNGERLVRYFAIYSPGSSQNIEFEECMRANRGIAAAAFLHYLGTRYCFTEKAFAFRERLLEWLPGKLGGVKLGHISLRKMVEPYMHCSYAITPHKHKIKADIINQMHRVCTEAGCPEMDPGRKPKPGRKPTVVVITEHFPDGHSVYRTHSRSVRALKERFHVVGVCYQNQVGPGMRSCFDELIHYPSDDYLPTVRKTAEEILKRDPDIVFHLGVGMSAHAIGLASLRLAPVQCVSFGHTATTMSPVIDYMILPEDFIGSPDVFSETLITVPPHAMPYEPRRDAEREIEAVRARKREETRPGDKVRVAIPASVMKLNPHFFAALAQMAKKADTEIEFHFFPLAAVGIAHLELTRRIHDWLPTAVVHQEAPYPLYMDLMGSCDFFVCPFPYGNMNSIIDAVRLGLPGVCLDGPEAHAHADVAFFARVALPRELATATIDDYIQTGARLADDWEWRHKCSQIAFDCDLDAAFFQGDEKLFCRMMEGLMERTPETAGA